LDVEAARHRIGAVDGDADRAVEGLARHLDAGPVDLEAVDGELELLVEQAAADADLLVAGLV
nr:hypothetical protein [Tanacetum cinerariifolium]